MQQIYLEWELGQKFIFLDQLAKDCNAKEMGRMGTERHSPICTSPSYKNGLDLVDWSESMDSYLIS